MNAVATALKWIIVLPILVVVTLLAVANDHKVSVRLNPFNASDTALSVDLALYQIAFLMFLLGVLIGGFVVWNNQRRYRRQARQEHKEAVRWRAKAESADNSPADTSGLLPAPKHHSS